MNRYRLRRLVSGPIAWSMTELALVGLAIRTGWILANHDDDIRSL